jgi:hypothetical protein
MTLGMKIKTAMSRIKTAPVRPHHWDRSQFERWTTASGQSRRSARHEAPSTSRQYYSLYFQ